MLKRLLKFSGFAVLAIIVWVQAHELFLAYIVLSPLLLLPAMLLKEQSEKTSFYACLIVIAVMFGVFFMRYRYFEIFLLGGLQILLLVFFTAYQKHWLRYAAAEARLSHAALANLEALKQKHQSRLESLHHLEKQVAGLLDLFEIARDFNDCLSIEGIAAILHERVRPELPFKLMTLVFNVKKDEDFVIKQVLCIHDRGVEPALTADALSYKDQKNIETLKRTKKMIHQENELAFPIIVDGDIAAYLLIEGVNPDDLAKFEVLAAYLALQIKKVRLYEAVKELSIQDGLTGVFVRRHFMERFDEELKRSIKYDLPLAVFMLDIDHFKRYNDSYGHLAGDATLKQVAALLLENLRRVDIVARYGGEEFVIVTPETRKAEALEVSERIRSNIARHNFKVYNDQTRATVSIGVSIFPDDVPDSIQKTDHSAILVELIHRADQALYRAKEEGRNRVITYQE